MLHHLQIQIHEIVGLLTNYVSYPIMTFEFFQSLLLYFFAFLFHLFVEYFDYFSIYSPFSVISSSSGEMLQCLLDFAFPSRTSFHSMLVNFPFHLVGFFPFHLVGFFNITNFDMNLCDRVSLNSAKVWNNDDRSYLTNH